MSEKSTPTIEVAPAAAVPSLRERKRAQTWRSIHEAAAGLAMSHEHIVDVSVDMIAEQANVSPRTFFNYFSSKEDAILGQRPPVISEEVAASFVFETEDDAVEKVAFLLLSVLRETTAGIGPEQRRTLMRRHPGLVHRGVDHIDDVRHLVQDLVSTRLAQQSRWHARPDVADAAQLIVLSASAVMRTAIPKLLNAPDPIAEAAIMHQVSTLFQEATRPQP